MNKPATKSDQDRIADLERRIKDLRWTLSRIQGYVESCDSTSPEAICRAIVRAISGYDD